MYSLWAQHHITVISGSTINTKLFYSWNSSFAEISCDPSPMTIAWATHRSLPSLSIGLASLLCLAVTFDNTKMKLLYQLPTRFLRRQTQLCLLLPSQVTELTVKSLCSVSKQILHTAWPVTRDQDRWILVNIHGVRDYSLFSPLSEKAMTVPDWLNVYGFISMPVCVWNQGILDKKFNPVC